MLSPGPQGISAANGLGIRLLGVLVRPTSNLEGRDGVWASPSFPCSSRSARVVGYVVRTKAFGPGGGSICPLGFFSLVSMKAWGTRTEVTWSLRLNAPPEGC